MKFIHYLFLTVLLFNSCDKPINENKIEKLFKEGVSERANKNLMNSINIFNDIYKNSPNSKFASLSQYQIGDIYLNDIKNYQIALEKFRSVFNKYPNTESGKISLFLCGYISNNYLNEFSTAYDYYNTFKETYPDDSLIFSVDYELFDPNTGLKNYIQVIDSLKLIN